ncbi:MAG: DNA topoisomerase (ATP-hydrolyzing) subunit B [Desulfobulbaceae bacterium]|jgi:DNA gyrase subunit B|nr:DNA topoisomerase (ATP-hydrolyzing) subunit B [Desulfobulbaceae bacterium]
MTDEQNNYGAENIRVLDGLEAVRTRPSMYIGNTGIEGLHHLIWEVVDNSIDEAVAGFCDNIRVTIHEDNSVSVEDNGRGIPVDLHPTEKISALELVMTTLHAGGKFDNSTYKVSGGLHGVGISVVNALSKLTIATVCRNGKVFRQSYEYGNKISELEIIGESDRTGTKITFTPDEGIFQESVVFDYETVRVRLRELSFLNKNVRILLKDERDGAEDNFFASGGLTSYVEFLNRNRNTVFPEPISFSADKDGVQVNIALQYFDGYNERLYSFVNNINTREGGTHVSGFRAALTKCINKYAGDDMIPKNLREKMGGDDVREGLTCVISVYVPNPQFEGQTKTKLGNSEVKFIVESVCSDKLTAFFEENPAVAKKVIEKVVEAARAREAAKRARDLSRKKSSATLLMAGKLAECQEKDPKKREIFIVEGDSAGGSAKQGRDRSIQAILPLRGKILNVEKARFDRILASDDIKNLIGALGCGIGKDEFALENLRYHKIIIMTDADVDGAHIRTLLLTFFYRQMLPLLQGGFIYIGQPPLFRLSKGKRELYFQYDDELRIYLFNETKGKLKIVFHEYEEKEFADDELVAVLDALSRFRNILRNLSLLNIPDDVILTLLDKKVKSSDQFNDVAFLDALLSALPTEKYSAGIAKNCQWKSGAHEADVVIKDKSKKKFSIGPHIPLSPEYRRALDMYPTLKPYLNSTATFRFVGKEGIIDRELKVESWSKILDTIQDEMFKGFHLQRYKGLGEMNPDQLWETTMNPHNRSLIQVNISDAEQADEMFTTLMGDKVEPRRDFIQSHAMEVTNLDI